VFNEEMMTQKLEYIHYNPVKRGYVDVPTDWRYSSARNYAGRDGLIEVCTDWR
jgi:putative transposase